jgi:hypothetical protein
MKFIRLFFRRGLLFALLASFASQAMLHATTVRPPTFPQLVARAGFVAETVVKSVRSERITQGANTAIFTYVTFVTRSAITGAVPGEFTLEFLGGTVGEESMTVVGMPQFFVGQRDVVFVEKTTGQICPLVTLGHGRYRIYTDASSSTPRIARDNGVPLEDVSEVELSMPDSASLVGALSRQKRQPLTLDAFVARIRETATEAAVQNAL